MVQVGNDTKLMAVKHRMVMPPGPPGPIRKLQAKLQPGVPSGAL